jgi:hypothetical protein
VRETRRAEEMWQAAAADPRLATLRTLRKGKGNVAHLGAFVASPSVRGLRHIEVPAPRTVELLLPNPVCRPVRLELGFRPQPKLLARMAQAETLAGLRELSISGRSAVIAGVEADLVRSGLLARIEGLWLVANDDREGVLDPVDLLDALPTTVRTVGTSYTLTRTDDGGLSATFSGFSWRADTPNRLIARLGDRLREITIGRTLLVHLPGLVQACEAAGVQLTTPSRVLPGHFVTR